MNYYIYEWKIRPKSSFVSKLHSDIIWGHIMWAISYLEGEKYLEKVLREYDISKGPFIVSNGFLSGYAPFVRKGYLNNIALIGLRDKMKLMDLNRLVNKFESINYIDISVFNEMRLEKKQQEVFQEVLTGGRCPVTLKLNSMKNSNRLAAFINSEREYLDRFNIVRYEDLIKSVNVLKSSVNRLSGSTDEYTAPAYNILETFYASDISVYIKLRENFEEDRLIKYLSFIQISGFGSRASAGKGQFETIYFKKIENLFDKPDDGNGFITLSNYIPKSGDYTEIISGKVRSKIGKLSGSYTDSTDVFKKPFAFYEAGAVFKGKPNNNKGRMLKGLHLDKNIVQYGLPFVLGVNIDE